MVVGTTHLKNMLVKLDDLPRDRGENLKNVWKHLQPFVGHTRWAIFENTTNRWSFGLQTEKAGILGCDHRSGNPWLSGKLTASLPLKTGRLHRKETREHQQPSIFEQRTYFSFREEKTCFSPHQTLVVFHAFHRQETWQHGRQRVHHILHG